MKTILLTTDFSKNAWNAIVYAVTLYKDEACTFHILNAYTPAFYRIDYFVGGPVQSAIPDVGVDISLAGLERTLKKLKKEYPNPKHQFKTISAFNTLTEQIKASSETINADLVIMGTQGATGAKEIFLGSNTVHVALTSKTPVMAVPAKYKFTKMKRVLLPTAYDGFYNEHELQPLLSLIQNFDATLHVLHAVENDVLTKTQASHKAHLAKQLASIEVVWQDITKEYMPNVVHEYADKNNIDLVVMMNRKHSFLERLLLKQNVEAIGYHSAVPFMVLRDTSKKVT
ncbi:MAG: universal stress protein [Croceitalea sp.]|nr:universal stress protein [Croceitalea sp.]